VVHFVPEYRQNVQEPGAGRNKTLIKASVGCWLLLGLMAPSTGEMAGHKRRAEHDSVSVGLNCDCCLDEFALPPSSKTPKVLHCLHTFCLSCCHQMAGGEEVQGDPCISIQCPTCQKETKLIQGFESLLSNFAVLKALDRMCVQPNSSQELIKSGYHDSAKQQRNRLDDATSGRNERQRKTEIWSILCNPFNSDVSSQSRTARAHVRSRLSTLKDCIATAKGSLETGEGSNMERGMALMFAVAKAEGYTEYVASALDECEDKGFLAIRAQVCSLL
jgi:hypothetical protein